MVFREVEYKSTNFKKTEWFQKSEVRLQDELVGSISVYYLEEFPEMDEGPFLKEERKLINTIAEQFGLYLIT